MINDNTANNKNDVVSVTEYMSKVINSLSVKLHLDPMYVIGSLFILELIKSKFAKYPLWAVFEKPAKISRRRIASEFVEKTNEIFLELNPQELVDFIASGLKFTDDIEEKLYIVKVFEENKLGVYDKDRDVFLYTGCPELVRAMRRIVSSYGSKKNNEDIH